MLSIEGRVVFTHSPPIPDFATALAVLFASFYVFNIEYQVEAATTLEFVQRYFSKFLCTSRFFVFTLPAFLLLKSACSIDPVNRGLKVFKPSQVEMSTFVEPYDKY